MYRHAVRFERDLEIWSLQSLPPHFGLSRPCRPDLGESRPHLGVPRPCRPQRDVDYPLWAAARDVWAANQPAEGTIAAELKSAGFEDVSELERLLQTSRTRSRGER